MYLKYIEGKSIVAEGFIRTLLKSKIYKKMTGNNCKSYLDYLNKLVDEYNNPYHCSTGKKPFHANYSAMSEEFESSHKACKFQRATKSYFTHYSFVVFILSSTGLCKSGFSFNSFRKLFFITLCFLSFLPVTC